jgi:tetratricopeptide (TPR) repeat protein
MGRARRAKKRVEPAAPATPSGGRLWIAVVFAFAAGLGGVAILSRAPAPRASASAAAASPTPASSRPAADVRPLLDRARSLMETHQLAAAQAELAQAEALAPQDAEVAFLRGDVAYRSLKMEAAEVYYRRATELAPQSAGAFANLALVLIQLGQTKPAAEAARRAMALDPSQPMIQAVLGQALLRDGRPQEAIPELESALARGAGGAEPLAALGRARDLNGRSEEALRAFDQAERQDPHLPLVHYWRSECLRRAGRVKEAQQSLTRYRQAEALIARLAQLQLEVQARPQDIQAWLDLAHAQLERGVAPEAMASVAQAERLAPGDGRVRRAHDTIQAILTRTPR